MTVKELKTALASYKDDAEVKVVITNGEYESVYSQCSYDISVEGENEAFDEDDFRKRNPQSNEVRITLYR